MSHNVSLTALIDRARAYKMTPTEKRAQRISMVYGLRGHSSTLTKERVETLLEQNEGSVC